MAKVEVYTKSWCGYSKAALRLLDRKGIDYVHIDVTDNRERELEMIARAHAHTVPQVFINGISVGGYDDISALDSTGELEKLLAGDVSPAVTQQQVEEVQNEQLHRT